MLVSVLIRVLHIAATCTSLGGLVYARAVLWPSLPSLPEAEREPFLRRVIRRYAYVKWTGVTVVAVTGVIQWMRVFPTVADRRLYLAAFAVKMVSAVGLFTITASLALPAGAFAGIQRRRGLWSAVNIVCGLGILTGAALMRAVR